jgi:hypothetical protein
LRAFSNSLLSLLVVAALFWGNCFSCPQLLLSLAKQDAHSCCKRRAPVTQKCTTNVLKHFVKADPVGVAAPAVMPAQQASSVVPPPASCDRSVATATPHSPPGLLELTSILRI